MQTLGPNSENVLSLLQIPAIISDNGGFDSAQLVSELRAVHTQGKHNQGISKYLGIWFIFC